MTITIPNNRVIPLKSKVGGGFESDYDPGAGPSAATSIWDFAAGDTLASPSKNNAGMSFDNLNFPIATSPQGRNGLLFRFGPDGPLEDSWQELRYRYNGGYEEVYEKIFLYVPSNLEHRIVTQVTISGTITNWVYGDTIRAENDGSRGTMVGKSGQVIYVKNAENGFSTSTWGSGTITNVTRSETGTSTGRVTDSHNNKFWFHWEGAYSSNGMGMEWWPLQPTFPNAPESDPRANATNTDTHGKGPNETSEAIAGKPLFDLANLGQEFEYVIRVKHATAAGVEDGICELWRDGELLYANYTMRLFDSVNNAFELGYLMGWSNSGFEQQTDFYITRYEFWADNRPPGLE